MAQARLRTRFRRDREGCSCPNRVGSFSRSSESSRSLRSPSRRRRRRTPILTIMIAVAIVTASRSTDSTSPSRSRTGIAMRSPVGSITSDRSNDIASSKLPCMASPTTTNTGISARSTARTTRMRDGWRARDTQSSRSIRSAPEQAAGLTETSSRSTRRRRRSIRYSSIYAESTTRLGADSRASRWSGIRMARSRRSTRRARITMPMQSSARPGNTLPTRCRSIRRRSSPS